ncbi:MAG: hypothetical protein WB245_02465 [Acidimicrobiia bacterium]
MPGWLGVGVDLFFNAGVFAFVYEQSRARPAPRLRPGSANPRRLCRSGPGGDRPRLAASPAAGKRAIAFGGQALLLERLSREGDTPGARLALQRWLTGYSTVLLVLVVALWDMIFKPTL